MRAASGCRLDPSSAMFGIVDDPPRPALVPEPEYDANGIDRTLVRYVLAMSPAERARTHDLLLSDIEKLEAAGRAARDVRT